MNYTQNISITRFIYNAIKMIFTIQYRLVLNINQLELNQQLVRILALNTVLELLHPKLAKAYTRLIFM